MTKSLTSKIYLKKQFGFKMDHSKSLEENLDEFNKIAINLANTDEKISNKNYAIIILNSLRETFKNVKVVIKYGMDSLSLGDVLGALWSKDLEMKFKKKKP